MLTFIWKGTSWIIKNHGQLVITGSETNEPEIPYQLERFKKKGNKIYRWMRHRVLKSILMIRTTKSSGRDCFQVSIRWFRRGTLLLCRVCWWVRRLALVVLVVSPRLESPPHKLLYKTRFVCKEMDQISTTCIIFRQSWKMSRKNPLHDIIKRDFSSINFVISFAYSKVAPSER